ncbi:S1C family serine protease [Streptomyces deccanensis]|uniref:S1C family serine protease n=1 Tax=Streptomyces deccanensis TaxID=424188 RepID=UPI001EFB51E7|nr:trypsin-like peptidase domain-containing protein [Streptomyces deccanensis]ULR53210.1 trypsin-like peptidase domain-containing protein [Streptomyces deccanensis]
MNEGKPTKAKWWSRPRAHGAGAETAGAESPGAGPAGTAGSGGPVGAVEPFGSPADAARAENPEGDFELERPAATTTPPTLASASGEADSDSDYELARPAAEAPPGHTSTPTVESAETDGDFELERPAVRNAATTGSAATTASAAATGSATAVAPAAVTPVTTVVGAADVGDARPAGAQGALSAPEAPSERLKPLHDPDPYGTPPYGEPGPWAPAPPVQHPATTPAPGTGVQPTTPAHDVHAVTGQPALDGATVPGAGSGGGEASASAVSSTRAGTPAAAAPAHPDAAAAVTPAHGTAVATATPQPAMSDQHPAAPRPGTAPFLDTAQSAATPYPDASQPPGASYAYPSQPGPPPFGDPARSVPPPYAGGVPAAQPPQPSQGAGGPHPSGAYADPGQSPHGSRGPWQNYDPWAGSGSLQQNGAAVHDAARRPRRRGRTLLIGALLIAVVAGGIGGAVGAYLERNGGVGAIELPQTSDGVTGRAPDSVAGIAASALPSVVTLHVSGDSAQGTGTGFVLDERGHILTNNHVVDPAGSGGEISVTFSGGETAKATMVGRDTGYDLAVVKVSGVSGLKPLPLGNSEEVQVGDPVVAIGAPFDLANTVTSGIISAKERPITAGGESGDVSDVSYVDALQTDAPINPGNSGGPLLDGKARVIGINSAIRSAGSGSESDGGQAGSIGLGFAIPINQGKRVAEELINTGKATHPVIGVTLDMDYSGDGARIGDQGDGGGSGVTSGGPADRAGMRSGDVITEVDGQRVHSGDELIVKVRAHRPGDRLELTLLRNGRERTVTLTLGSSGGD